MFTTRLGTSYKQSCCLINFNFVNFASQAISKSSSLIHQAGLFRPCHIGKEFFPHLEKTLGTTSLVEIIYKLLQAHYNQSISANLISSLLSSKNKMSVIIRVGVKTICSTSSLKCTLKEKKTHFSKPCSHLGLW